MRNSLVERVMVTTLVCGGISLGLAQDPSSRGSLMKEERVVSYGKDGIATVRMTWHVRPPFYAGPLPFTYLAGVRDYGIQYGIRSIAWMDFGKFKVNFQVEPSFNPVIPGLARAVGRNGEVLAEARAVRLIKGAGFEVQETHFGPGKQSIFECRSLFDFKGWKTEETVTKGKKGEEYFFLWSSER